MPMERGCMWRNAISDAIAVIDTTEADGKVATKGMVEPIGFVPTEWMPMSMAFVGAGTSGKLYVATAKGKGTGPNGTPMKADIARPALLYGPTRTSRR